MKKLCILLSVIFLSLSFSMVFAKDTNENSENSKKSSQEEETDKFFKNIIDTIDKTAKDSTNKIADEIKEMQKDSK